MRKVLLPTLMLALLTLPSYPALSSWRTQVPDAQQIGQGELSLFGFRVYSARLLSQSRPFNMEQPFALQLTYHRSISRDDLVEVSLEEISRLSPGAISAQQLSQWQTEMQQAFVDVEPGMQITGVFVPERGCLFYVGEQLQHSIDDPAFAKAFFSIWLAPDTREPELREQLLGKS
jgi:hypothetical protein